MSANIPARQTKRRFTPRQVLFIREYLVDRNATAAAKRAGYSPKSAHAQGHRLLKDAEIVNKIQRAVNARAKRLDATADRLVQELMRIVTADIRDVVRVEGTAT